MSDNWNIKGNYFESCTCGFVCPCIFLKPPTEGYCEAFVAWNIEKGHMDDTDLSGLKVAAWLHAPGLLTEGGWKLALYIDENANETQKESIGKIYGGEVGGHPAVIASLVGEVMGVHSAAINIVYEEKRKVLEVKGVGHVKMNAMDGEDGGLVKVSNHPLAVSPANPVIIHESESLEYNDHGKNWRQSGTVGLAAPFEYKP